MWPAPQLNFQSIANNLLLDPNFNVATWHPVETHHYHSFQPQDQQQHVLPWYPSEQDNALPLAPESPMAHEQVMLLCEDAPTADAQNVTNSSSQSESPLTP
eukprot:271458-Rhodomonas_salina.1